ncbi:MAG: ketoacyl-ACP synthase III [Bacteroidales bacterium]
MEKDEIEILIFVSQSRDYILPHTSAILQDRLGLSKKCLAFDVGLGCTAFVYGLSIINSLISLGKIKKGLLLMGDISSNGSYRDKSSYPLFGDAGTATACIFDETAPESFYNLQTDGAGYDAIIAPTGGNRNKFFKKALVYKKIEDGIYRNAANVVLNGIEVFNFALREVAPNVVSLLEYANTDIRTIDHFVLHQANKLMNNTIRMKLKAPKDKFPLSLDKYGNTSSATIPVTIVSELRDQVSNSELNMLFSGFGVGLSWGSVLTQTKNMVCPEMLIYEDHIKHLNQNKYHYKVK